MKPLAIAAIVSASLLVSACDPQTFAASIRLHREVVRSRVLYRCQDGSTIGRDPVTGDITIITSGVNSVEGIVANPNATPAQLCTITGDVNTVGLK